MGQGSYFFTKYWERAGYVVLISTVNSWIELSTPIFTSNLYQTTLYFTRWSSVSEQRVHYPVCEAWKRYPYRFCFLLTKNRPCMEATCANKPLHVSHRFYFLRLPWHESKATEYGRDSHSIAMLFNRKTFILSAADSYWKVSITLQ